MTAACGTIKTVDSKLSVAGGTNRGDLQVHVRGGCTHGMPGDYAQGQSKDFTGYL